MQSFPGTSSSQSFVCPVGPDVVVERERRAEKWTPRHGESTRTGRLRCFFAGQVDESEIWSTFVYRGAWKWEYVESLVPCRAVFRTVNGQEPLTQ